MRPATRPAAALLVAAVAILAGCGSDADDGGPAEGSITVAAASDLRPAFDEVAERFESETGVEVTLSYGSSGLMAEQVAAGAPFDLFASASREFVDEVVATGRGDPGSRAVYAIGGLVVWSPEGAVALRDLTGPDIEYVAIANPTHAPYGIAARQALRSAGILDELERELVYGENVQDTQRMAASGNADAAIIALSLAIDAGGDWQPVPRSLHERIEQELVLISDGGSRPDAAAERFARLLLAPEGREILERYGFSVPDGRAAARDGASRDRGRG